ncbi:MAG: dihydropyrimidinase [Verrucomicrobiota bacterium]
MEFGIVAGMALLIKNGTLVNADGRQRADLYAEGETITRLGPGLDAPPGAEILDAAGKLVFPGFIDPHTHIYLPFMGTYSKDGYASAGRAALLGGTTTLFDMCIPGRGVRPWEGFDTWMAQAAGQAACDYSFHLGIGGSGREYWAEMADLVEQKRIPSFKVFLAYKDALHIEDDELYETLKMARRLGVRTTAHCENAQLVHEHQAQLLAAGKTDPEWHHDSRPPVVEALGVHHLCTFAELTGAPVYIVHLSCEQALDAALDARARGVEVAIETLIQYLLLSHDDTKRPDFEGSKFVMSPPLRDRRHQDILWKALADGTIDTLATDHAPFDFAGQKEMGRGDFTRIPNGIPSLEERVKLLYSEGVAKDRLSPERFVEVASTNAAKLFGLYPRKGVLAPGSDADIVIYDPDARSVISADTHSMQVDYSAFEGWEVTGRPETVVLRGQVAVRDGEFVGEAGRGQFLPRNPVER